MPNKIKYGLKNVYYAVATIDSNGGATYTTPVAIPGAVNLSMEPQGESTPFYADNIVYYMGVANNGYHGDLEIALIPEAFKKDILGYIESANKLLAENAAAEPVHFALLVQFEGDSKAVRHVLYNCVAQRPAVTGATKEESVTPQTETLTLTATSIYVSALTKDIVKAETDSNTTSTVYDGWFTAVVQPTAPAVTT